MRADFNEKSREKAMAVLGDKARSLNPFRDVDVYKKNQLAKFWGEAVVFRCATQANYDYPDYDLLGEDWVSIVQWDGLPEQMSHFEKIKVLLETDPGAGKLFFEPSKPSMFLKSSPSELVEFLQKEMSNGAVVKADAASATYVVELSDDWQKLEPFLVRWCNDIWHKTDVYRSLRKPLQIHLSVAAESVKFKVIDLVKGPEDGACALCFAFEEPANLPDAQVIFALKEK